MSNGLWPETAALRRLCTAEAGSRWRWRDVAELMAERYGPLGIMHARLPGDGGGSRGEPPQPVLEIHGGVAESGARLPPRVVAPFTDSQEPHWADAPVLWGPKAIAAWTSVFGLADGSGWVATVPFLAADEPSDRLLVFSAGARVPRVEHLALELNLGLALAALGPMHSRLRALGEVQQQLLPHRPTIMGLDYALHYQPAEFAAGDYLDLMNLSHVYEEGRSGVRDVWGLMVADVSGHGPAAALEMGMFDAILRTYQGHEPGGPAGVLNYANRFFFSRRVRQAFVTCLAVLYLPAERRARFVNAGHPPLLHWDGQQVLERGATGLPLGVDQRTRYGNQEFVLAPGDTLLLYTDGVSEARDGNGVEFGFEPLRELLVECHDDPGRLVGAIKARLFEHQGGPVGADDQTLAVVRLHDPE